MTNTNIETKAREIIEDIAVEFAWDDREEFRKEALAALEGSVKYEGDTYKVFNLPFLDTTTTLW